MTQFEDESTAERTLLTNPGSRDVVVLGSGFSKAVSSRFPVTDELGHLALAAAGLDSRDRFPGGNFEAWLSYLAEPQPFLRQADNLANRALFARLVDAIHEVLCGIESEVVEAGIPAWHSRFVAALHARRATVITFNYDRLVERTLGDLNLHDFGQGSGSEGVQWADPLGQVPPFPPNPMRWAGEARATFRLCKLHGSLNWFWVPDDKSGATLHHWELDDDPVGRSRYLPGREPFLVPPASTKSAFFANPIMTETWRRAHEALSKADRVWFVGYSLPLTDLTSAGMVSATLARDNVEIRVVNTNPTPVLESIDRLIGRRGATCEGVEQFVGDYVTAASLALAELCRSATDLPADTRVVVGWNKSLLGRVAGVVNEPGRLVVRVDEFDGRATGVQHDSNNEAVGMALLMSDLAAALGAGDLVVARFASGQESVLVGIDRFYSDHGASTNWQVLMPADHPGSVGVAL